MNRLCVLVKRLILCAVLGCASVAFSGNFHLGGSYFSKWNQDGTGAFVLYFSGGAATVPEKGDISIEPPVEDCRFSVEPWEDDCIKVVGSFKPETYYALRIRGSYSAKNGDKLGHDIVHRIKVPRMSSLVSLLTQGMFLPLGRKNWTLPLAVRNVSELTMTVREVFDSNLVAYDFASMDIMRTAGVIGEKTYAVKLRKNEKHECTLVLDDVLPKSKPGIYLIDLLGTDRTQEGKWLQSDYLGVRMVVVTDLGLTVFHGPKSAQLAVCVRKLSDGVAVADASVSVYNRQNQLMTTCRTDAEGMALIPAKTSDGFDMAAPRLVMAASGGDRTFVCLDTHYNDGSPHAVELQGADDGMPLATGAQAFLYFERGVARPGEEIVAAAYVMDRSETAICALESYPCVLKVTNPLGDEVFRKKVKTGRGGFVMQRISLDAACPTGQYRAVLSIDGGRELARAGILVASYVPDKVKVDVKADKAVVGKGESVTFALDAAYYYGASARNLPVNVTLSYGRWSPEESWKGYSVGDSEGMTLPCPETTRYSSVDAAGNVRYECVDCSVKYVPMKVLCQATVLEPGGRGVTGKASVKACFSPWYLGVKKTDSDASATLLYRIFAGASEEQKPATSVDAEMSLSRVVWENNLVEKSGRYRYEWERVVRPMKSGIPVTLQPSGGGIELGALESGQYEVILTAGDAVRTRCTFWHWEGEGGLRGDDPNVLVFKTDRESYAPGDKATLSFDSAEDGFAVVACGEAALSSSRAFQVKAGRNDVVLSVPGELLTERYYCCVTAVTGPECRRRSCGVAALRVSQAKHRLDVQLRVPETVRPGSKVDIGIALADAEGRAVSGNAHVFLVDAGVLSLTGYGTPDIFGFCHGPRKCDIRLWDVYGAIYPDLVIQNGVRIGGDETSRRELAKKTGNGVDIESAVVVLDAVSVDAGGSTTVTARVPKHFGAMKVMCVAVADGREGSGDKLLTVRNEVDVLGVAPRTVSPGDEFELTFLLHNFDVKAQDDFVFEVTLPLGLTASGAVRHSGKLAMGERKMVTVPVRATATGKMAVGYSLLVGTAGSRKELSVCIRSCNPPVAECETAIVAPGQTRVVAMKKANWLNGEVTASVTASEPLLAGAAESLDWLNRYPYGCLEQTVSCAFPFLFLPSLVASGVISQEEAAAHRPKLSAAVRRIMSMYTGSGKFTLWPGSTETGNVGVDAGLFAAHYLYALNRQQPQSAALLDQIEMKSLVPMMEDTAVSRGRRGYCAYILSLRNKSAFGGESPALSAARNILADGQKDIGSFLASASLVRMGYAADAMPAFNGCLDAQVWRRQDAVFCFDDAASRMGMILAILMEIQPTHAAGGEIAAELQRMLRPGGNGYGTTQSNAWAVTGLATYCAHHGQTDMKGTYSLNGDAPQTWNTKEKHTWTLTCDDKLAIANTGGAPLFLRLRREGVRNGPMAPVTGVISVTRAYLDRNGKPIQQVRQGDLLTVRLTLHAACSLESLVLVDMLPGGFEIEDDQLATRADASRGDNAGGMRPLRPVHVDKRDDRFLLFGDMVDKGTAQVTYKVRAVTRGRYTQGPVICESMYLPDIRCVEPGSGMLEIK